MRFVFSGAPEPPSLISIISCLSIPGAQDTRVTKRFGIFSESTRLNNLQLIAQENRCHLLKSPGTDPALYLSNHPEIDRLSKRYPVNVSYSETRLGYSRLTRRIPPSISSLRNAVQAHLRSTLLMCVTVSDLTPHTYSIQRLISTMQALIIHI